MNSIDIEIIKKMINVDDKKLSAEVKASLEFLIDYADYVSSLENKIKELNMDSRVGIYIAGQMDSERREKHDIAINTLYDLNKLATQNGFGEVYSGSFEDKCRGEIALAIMNMCKELL